GQCVLGKTGVPGSRRNGTRVDANCGYRLGESWRFLRPRRTSASAESFGGAEIGRCAASTEKIARGVLVNIALKDAQKLMSSRSKIIIIGRGFGGLSAVGGEESLKCESQSQGPMADREG